MILIKMSLKSCCWCKLCMQKSDEHLPVMSELLGTDTEQIRFWLCNRKIVTANETVTKPLTSTQVCRVLMPQTVMQNFRLPVECNSRLVFCICCVKNVILKYHN